MESGKSNFTLTFLTFYSSHNGENNSHHYEKSRKRLKLILLSPWESREYLSLSSRVTLLLPLKLSLP